MKIKIITLFALIISCSAIAQQKNSSLSFTGGITEKDGLGFMMNYTYSSNNANYEFAVLHSIFKDDKIPDIDYSITTLNIGYLQTVLRNTNNSITLNIGAGLIGGYENIPENKDVIIKSESGLVAGAYAVLQTDFYISDTFSIILRGQQNYLGITNTGAFNPYIAGGIKFNL